MALQTILDRLVTVIEFDEQSEELETTQKRVKNLRQDLDQLGNTLIAAGTALAGFGAFSVKTFADVEHAMDKLATRTGGTFAEMETQYGASIRKMRLDTGVGADEIINTYIRAISAGITGAEADADVRTAAHFQAAQLGGAEDVLSTATTLWGEYKKVAMETGREVLSVRDHIDLIAKTAQVGEGQAQDFASAFKFVAPLAAELGATETEFASLLATISHVAPSANEGATQLRSFMTALLNTTPQAEKAYEKLGTTILDVRNRLKREGFFQFYREFQLVMSGDLSFGQARDLIAEGLSDEEILSRFGRRDQGQKLGLLGDILGRREAQSFALGAKMENIEMRHSFIAGETGLEFRGASERADRQYESLTQKTQKFRESIKLLGESVGATLAPGVKRVTDNLAGMAETMADSDSAAGELGAAASLLGAGMLTAGIGIRGVSWALGALSIVTRLNPIGIIATAVAALGLALAVVVEDWDEFAAKVARGLGFGGETAQGKLRDTRMEMERIQGLLSDQNIQGQGRIELQQQLNELLEREIELQKQANRELETKRLTGNLEKYASDILGLGRTGENRAVVASLRGAATRTARELARLQLGEDAPDFSVLSLAGEILDREGRQLETVGDATSRAFRSVNVFSPEFQAARFDTLPLANPGTTTAPNQTLNRYVEPGAIQIYTDDPEGVRQVIQDEVGQQAVTRQEFEAELEQAARTPF